MILLEGPADVRLIVREVVIEKIAKLEARL